MNDPRPRAAAVDSTRDAIAALNHATTMAHKQLHGLGERYRTLVDRPNYTAADVAALLAETLRAAAGQHRAITEAAADLVGTVRGLI